MRTRTFFCYYLSPRTKVHKYKSRKLSTKGPKAPRPQNETKIISSMMQQEGRGNPTHYAQMDEQEREATILGYTDTWRLVVQQWQYVRYSSINRKKAGQYYYYAEVFFIQDREGCLWFFLVGKTQFLLFSAHCMVSRLFCHICSQHFVHFINQLDLQP